jgi:hypothetical protein
VIRSSQNHSIGGSDNHRPQQPLDQVGSIGRPTTVVYASELSAPAILDGIRAGHVFIDVAGTANRILEVSARAGRAIAHSGDLIDVAAGAQMQIEAHVVGAMGGTVHWIEDGQDFSAAAEAVISRNEQTIPLAWTSDGRRHWFRAEVAAPDGELWLIANPVYLNRKASSVCH